MLRLPPCTAAASVRLEASSRRRHRQLSVIEAKARLIHLGASSGSSSRSIAMPAAKAIRRGTRGATVSRDELALRQGQEECRAGHDVGHAVPRNPCAIRREATPASGR